MKVDFIQCQGLYDSDQSYQIDILPNTYKKIKPQVMPINPPYKKAIEKT